jgi:hypothetical protein
MAFANNAQARLPVSPSRDNFDDAAGFALMLRTGGLHPPKEGSTLRFNAQVSLNAGRLLQRCLGTSFGRTCTG